jgi:glycosyltransferase involved in cell wall biosynthesis
MFKFGDHVMPKVSVCIPSYNYANYLKDAIDSVLCQTYNDFELLIVDNCSTDNTREVVEGYQLTDSRIIYYCNETNIGLVGNLNRCLELATGEYVKFLCADDLLLPACLERMVMVLDRHPDVRLVVSARKMVTSSLQPIRSLAYSFREEYIPGVKAINRCLFNGNQIGEPTAVIFRKQDASRGFRTDYSQLVDLEMWFCLLEQGDFMSLPEELCLFRQHDAQGTKTNLRTFSFLDDDERLFREYLPKPYIDATRLKVFNWKFINTWNIWKQRKDCDDQAVVRQHMDRYMNRYLFYALMLPAMGTKKIIKIWGRLSASFGQGEKQRS